MALSQRAVSGVGKRVRKRYLASRDSLREQYRTIHSKVMSVSQERRCKRGGGYRMQAK